MSARLHDPTVSGPALDRPPGTPGGPGRAARALLVGGGVLALLIGARLVAAGGQAAVTDRMLVEASGDRTVAIGTLSGDGTIAEIPLELYVARVLAGEGEPNAAPAARQALAVAIRTYAMVQLGRHRREGFDLCDTVHCQVLRAANDDSRRAALSTVGRVLAIDGRPAEVFYSASCGGRSEAAATVWPGATFPYLQGVHEDAVHAEDEPWMLELTIGQIGEALAVAGFGGRLRALAVTGHTGSGRVDRLRLDGMRPGAIAGTAFRSALGTTRVRSTAFTLTQDGDRVQLTGRGYGHGVGMCVIGAGRRARRGEDVEAILGQYYPALELADLGTLVIPGEGAFGVREASEGGIVARVPAGAALGAADLRARTARAHESLSRTLGTSISPVTVELHATLDDFRLDAGQPPWVSGAATGTTIDLAPEPVLAQREGVELVLRTAMAEMLVAPALEGRPAWVRVGAARYFAAAAPPAVTAAPLTCPADAELLLALSAEAQREAEARAVQCFARGLARTGDWREVQ
jgi:SpoIID/LytB domain protein